MDALAAPDLITAAPDLPAAPGRFDAVSIALHWVSVLMILGLFVSAWSQGLTADRDQAAGLLTVHRSTGVVLWVLVVLRLAWRFSRGRRPALPPAMHPLQVLAARLNELVLYVLMVLQPLTGLAQSLARGRPFPLFGLDVPAVMARDRALASGLHQFHDLTAWALLGLIGLNAGAGVLHGLVLRDGVLDAMLPWAGRRSRGEGAPAA
jgi:cytochrome b561